MQIQSKVDKSKFGLSAWLPAAIIQEKSSKKDPVLWLINGIVNQYWFGNSQVPLCLAKDRATQNRTIIKNPGSKIQHKKYGTSLNLREG